jgi:hypothetical protein
MYFHSFRSLRLAHRNVTAAEQQMRPSTGSIDAPDIGASLIALGIWAFPPPITLGLRKIPPAA